MDVSLRDTAGDQLEAGDTRKVEESSFRVYGITRLLVLNPWPAGTPALPGHV